MIEENYIDITYNGKLKKQYTIDEVYNKIQNYIKRNKLSKIWICEKENNNINIKFNDVISDDFVLDLSNIFLIYKDFEILKDNHIEQA